MKIDQHSTCQFMGSGSTKITCNHPVKPGYNYCEEHWRLIYQEGSALRKRHKDIRVADNVLELQSLLDEVVAELELEEDL